MTCSPLSRNISRKVVYVTGSTYNVMVTQKKQQAPGPAIPGAPADYGRLTIQEVYSPCCHTANRMPGFSILLENSSLDTNLEILRVLIKGRRACLFICIERISGQQKKNFPAGRGGKTGKPRGGICRN